MCVSFSLQSNLRFCSFATCCEEEGIGSVWYLYFVYKIWVTVRVTKPGFKDFCSRAFFWFRPSVEKLCSLCPQVTKGKYLYAVQGMSRRVKL